MAADKTSMLHVRLMEARNVQPADANGMSDPYCKIKVEQNNDVKRFKTSVKNKSLNPVWNEDFTFTLKSFAGKLVIKLYDKDVFRDDFLGRVTIPLESLQNKVTQAWFDMYDMAGEKRVKGSIMVIIVKDDDQTALFKKDKPAFLQHRRSLIYKSIESYDEKQHQLPKAKLFIGTWNVGNKPPPEDLSAWIPKQGYDLYIIGTQECEYKHRGGYSSCKEDWEGTLKQHFGNAYQLVVAHEMWEMRIAVFASAEFVKHITHVEASKEATGAAHVFGNKGGVAVSMLVGDSRVCFINSHLAAHQDKTKSRNANVEEILKGVRLGYKGFDVINQFHHVFWIGDLNYRLNYAHQGDDRTPSTEQFEEMVDLIKQGKYSQLFAHDQLRAEIKEERVFLGFQEGEYNFPPTFKVKRHTAEIEYDEERSPAWCDRVLWKSMDGLNDQFKPQQISLASAPNIITSDHKPVLSTFELPLPEFPPGVSDTLGECSIHITNLSGSGLPAADLNNEADPYLVFVGPFLASKVQTAHKNKTREPKWSNDEVPVVPLSVNRLQRLEHCMLLLKVMDHDTASRDDVMANGVLPLKAFLPKNEQEALNTKPYPFNVDLFAGGLRAGTIQGEIQLKWLPSDFKP